MSQKLLQVIHKNTNISTAAFLILIKGVKEF